MGTTRKVTRKVNIGIEAAAGTYVDGDVDVNIPFTSHNLKQQFDMIPDESIVGISFADLPIQGVRKVTGTISAQVDIHTLPEILTAAFGDASSPYDLPTDANTKSLSITTLDGVKTNRYAGCYVNNFTLQSAAEGDLNWSGDFIGWKAESRVDSAFPSTTTSPGERLAHHHAGGTNGYIRIGDQADALDSGDDQDIKDISFGVNWNFDFDFVNDQESLIPLSGAGGRPETTLSFTIARHTVDTWKAARDAATQLQLEANYYYSASIILKIQVPNFIITDCPESEDDVATQPCTCIVARNGIGASYSNSNMSFNTPIRITLTDA